MNAKMIFVGEIIITLKSPPILVDFGRDGKRGFATVGVFFFGATLVPVAACFLAADLGGAAAGVFAFGAAVAGLGAYEVLNVIQVELKKVILLPFI
jgi:hypothetical protein